MALTPQQATPQQATPRQATPRQATPQQATPPQSSSWPQFRGLQAAGVADGADLPETFSGIDGTNLAWRTEIPGLAHASPIVWGDRVFVTSAVSEAAPQRYFAEAPDSRESIVDDTPHRWVVMALDAASGEVLWERTAAEGVPRAGRLRKGTFNNSTPVTDGAHVVALFGSRGLFCYDIEGNLQWQVDLGELRAGWFFDPTVQWGTASSPVIHDGKVIVQADVFGGSFIAAFALADGRELWRTPRDEISSWATPTVVTTPAGAEIVTNGGRAIRGYDAATGAMLWSLGPSSEIAVPTPVFAGGLVFVGSGYLPEQPFYAVRPGGSGDISPTGGEGSSAHVAWARADGGPLIATPIVVGDYLYLLHRDGTLWCFDAGSGLPMYREKIVPDEQSSNEVAPADTASGQGTGDTSATGGGAEERPPASQEPRPPTFSASPIAADDLLYIVSDAGDVYVIESGPFLRVVAVNPVGEAVFATPAIGDGMLLVRGLQHLFAFARSAS
jgi:outer membrane protein assembly factor BamB